MNGYSGHLVIEGPIGVGKTSLARRIAASLGSELLLEQPADNPFLQRFYSDPKSAALPTQLFFLFQRSGQFQQLRQNDLFRLGLVSDFMLQKDRLFAELTLNRDELDLYQQVYRRVTPEAPRPDLVVYLQAPVGVLQHRISKRGRAYERGLGDDYLQRLCDAYARFFHDYTETPLLIVNAAQINPLERESDYQALLQQICSVRQGRHYFNPEPMLL